MADEVITHQPGRWSDQIRLCTTQKPTLSSDNVYISMQTDSVNERKSYGYMCASDEHLYSVEW